MISNLIAFIVGIMLGGFVALFGVAVGELDKERKRNEKDK